MMRSLVRAALVVVLVLLPAGLGACRSAAARSDAPQGGRCTATSACAPGELCDFEPGLCGKGKGAGTCRPVPAACGDAYAPVCGCDGVVYPSECDARAAGVDLAVAGGCRQGPPSWAPCGARFCDVTTSYCEIVLSDVTDPPTDYACRPLPASCLLPDGAEPACDCFPEGTRCRSFCGPMDTHGGRKGFHLTCRL